MDLLLSSFIFALGRYIIGLVGLFNPFDLRLIDLSVLFDLLDSVPKELLVVSFGFLKLCIGEA